MTPTTPAQDRYWRRWRNHDPTAAERFTPGRYTCPSCGGRGRLKVSYDDRKVIAHCFGECTQVQVRERLSLKVSDLYDYGSNVAGTLTGTYTYDDEDGIQRLRVHRYDKPTDVRYEVWRDGGWIPERPSIKGSWPLYRLADVLAAVEAGERVYVVDDERHADALAAVGVVATCTHQKPGKPWNVQHTEYVRDGYLTIIARRGEAGAKHARALARELRIIARDVELREPATNRPGAGAAEHLAEGFAVDEFEPLTLLDPGEQAAPTPPLPEVERSEGAAILDEVEGVYRHYVAWSNEHQAIAVTLWTAHTHAADSSDTTPYLAIESAEPESGKTRTLEVAEQLAARAWMLVEPSEAAMFRKIERDKPTLLLDEADALWGAKADGREGLRALLNAGYRRGAMVPRCVGEGTGMGVQDFPVYGPKALAGLAGKLPRTIASRSIPIRLRRRAKGEQVERFRLGRAAAELEPLRLRLAAWIALVTPDLEAADPDIPGPLSDRQADCWESLLALADAAGGDWPKRARTAAVELHGHDPAADPSTGVLLLTHILEAFMDAKAKRLPTAQLLGRLVDREDGPWAEWWARDVEKGETKGPAAKLAKLLKPYGIAPKVFKVGGESLRGYVLEAFKEAFNRYLPPTPLLNTKPRNAAGQSPYSDVTDFEPVTSPQAADQQGYEVTPGNGEEGGGRVFTVDEWRDAGRPGLEAAPSLWRCDRCGIERTALPLIDLTDFPHGGCGGHFQPAEVEP